MPLLTNSTTVELSVVGVVTQRHVATVQRQDGLVKRVVQITRIINGASVVNRTEVGSVPGTGTLTPPVIASSGAVGDTVTYTRGNAGAQARLFIDDVPVLRVDDSKPIRLTPFMAGKTVTLVETLNDESISSNAIVVSRVVGASTLPTNDLYSNKMSDWFEDTNRARINNTGALPAGSTMSYRNQKRWGPDTHINNEKAAVPGQWRQRVLPDADAFADTARPVYAGRQSAAHHGGTGDGGADPVLERPHLAVRCSEHAEHAEHAGRGVASPSIVRCG